MVNDTMALFTEIIGYSAATIGTLLMVPQVLKSIRTRSAKDISAWMLAAYLIQCALWGTYGFLLGAVPLLLCNAVAFCIGAFQASLKWRYG